MSGTDLLVNHAMKLVLIAILAGLFARRKLEVRRHTIVVWIGL